MPRLSCNCRQFVSIIEAHGFTFHRQGATNHKQYRRESGGRVWLVTVSAHNWGTPIKPKTLASMIRQSGLNKSLFRN